MDAATYLSILQTVIGILGILGNGLVCVVIAKVPAMKTLTNAFIFNQAIIDFLASLMMILRNVRPPLPENEVLATIQCRVWDSAFLLWVLFVTSTFNLVLLTLERYIAIVYPFRYVRCFDRKSVTIMLVCVWVFAAGYECYVVAFHEVVDGVCTYIPPKDVSFALGIITFLLQYLIPVIFMTFCYIHIILQLKKGASTVHPEPTTTQGGENSMSGSLLRAKRNTLKTLFIVSTTYVICWSPNQIAFFMFNFGFQLNFAGAFYVISVAMVLLNSCVNPIIYAFKYKQFQRGLRVLLSPCCPKLAVRSDEDTVATISSRAPEVARKTELTSNFTAE